MVNNLAGVKGQRFTKDNAAENGRIGGIKSGIAKRNKKALKEVIVEIMRTPVKSRKKGVKGKKLEDIKSLEEIKDCDLDVQTAIVFAQVKKALNGDVVAATFIRDTMGENPAVVAKIEATAKVDATATVNVSPIEKLAMDLYGTEEAED